MNVEITLSTLIDQLFTRIITFVTLRVVFSFFNESKGVWVIVKCVSTSKLVIWVFSKNTFGMCRITTIYTIVKPMLWDSFFFTNITVIFTRVIFSSVTESEGMFMLPISCGMR
ncbi:hypothetical protein ACJW30_03G042000 [Castanea mollissima]